MYLQDKTNLVIGQSVNKHSASCSTATSGKICLPTADRFNSIIIWRALSREKLVFQQLNEFLAEIGSLRRSNV